MMNATVSTYLSLSQLVHTGRTLISTEEAAYLLNLKPQTMYKWACYENGPISPVRIGRSVKWRLSDVASLVH